MVDGSRIRSRYLAHHNFDTNRDRGKFLRQDLSVVQSNRSRRKREPQGDTTTMIPKLVPKGTGLARQTTGVVLRRLSNGGAISCSSQVPATIADFFRKGQSRGDHSWWSSSLPKKAAAIAAGAAGSFLSFGLMGDNISFKDQGLFPHSSAMMTTGLLAACEEGNADDETTDVINWSGTHQVTVANKNYWEPESVEEVENIVAECQKRGQTVRPLGSSLSPNGVALNKDGMIGMANIDKVLVIDTDNRTITVQAGIPVREVSIVLPLEIFVLEGEKNAFLSFTILWRLRGNPYFILYLDKEILLYIITNLRCSTGDRSIATPQPNASQLGIHRGATDGRIYAGWCSWNRKENRTRRSICNKAENGNPGEGND